MSEPSPIVWVDVALGVYRHSELLFIGVVTLVGLGCLGVRCWELTQKCT